MPDKVLSIKQSELLELTLYAVARGMVVMNQGADHEFGDEALIDMLVKESNNSKIIASIPDQVLYGMCERIMKESVAEGEEA